MQKIAYDKFLNKICKIDYTFNDQKQIKKINTDYKS